MNDDLAALLFTTLHRVEEHIRAEEYLAVLAVEGPRPLVLSDYDYLLDRDAAEAFERRAAAHARSVSAIRWVLAVPQVWVINKRDVSVRSASPHPLREGEQEAITWVACDHAEGVDYGRVAYARRPSREPVFEEPEVFTVPLLPGELMPGYILLRSVTSEDDEPTSD
jgi:hypothetical protein